MLVGESEFTVSDQMELGDTSRVAVGKGKDEFWVRIDESFVAVLFVERSYPTDLRGDGVRFGQRLSRMTDHYNLLQKDHFYRPTQLLYALRRERRVQNIIISSPGRHRGLKCA